MVIMHPDRTAAMAGEILNPPMIVQRQIHGGLVQGIGQVF